MNRTLTLQQLIDADACSGHCTEFKKRFGASVEITPELCASVASIFSFWWAAQHFLSSSALAEYERASAWAFAEFERVCGPAWAEYVRVNDSASAEFERVCATEYKRVCAVQFAVAYSQE